MYTKESPFLAKIQDRVLLSKEGSTRKTYHLVLNTEGAHLPFKVGDSVGVFPANNPQTVEKILSLLQTSPQTEIIDPRTQKKTPLQDYLLYKANLNKAPLHKLFGGEKSSLPLVHQLEEYRPDPQELCNILLPLLPRFYSIASSPSVFPHEIHLTVAHVSFEIDGQLHFGVGSHFLSQQAEIGLTPIPIYIQPSNHFTLPEDPRKDIVLIGPGTGIAPFRGFIQERIAQNATGKNWLLFGERNRASDFYYGDYFSELEKQGKLQISTAFSRDQAEKVYVQHRLLQEAKTLWEWVENGCSIYVCGDAKKMAKDVEKALLEIVHLEGKMSQDEARAFLKAMRLEKRYLLDVY